MDDRSYPQCLGLNEALNYCSDNKPLWNIHLWNLCGFLKLLVLCSRSQVAAITKGGETSGRAGYAPLSLLASITLALVWSVFSIYSFCMAKPGVGPTHKRYTSFPYSFLRFCPLLDFLAYNFLICKGVL